MGRKKKMPMDGSVANALGASLPPLRHSLNCDRSVTLKLRDREIPGNGGCCPCGGGAGEPSREHPVKGRCGI